MKNIVPVFFLVLTIFITGCTKENKQPNEQPSVKIEDSTINDQNRYIIYLKAFKDYNYYEFQVKAYDQDGNSETVTIRKDDIESGNSYVYNFYFSDIDFDNISGFKVNELKESKTEQDL